MRWFVGPIVAALVLGVSGFLNELEKTTVASVELAEASREAPADTREAAEDVSDLPRIADLTSRQADAFETLADALEVSAQRVFSLNETLDRQAGTIDDLVAAIRGLHDPFGCVEQRLGGLTRTAARVPPQLNEIPPVLALLTEAQEKSLRHLESINRKLTAFGVAARASRVEVPPQPEIPSFDIETPEPQLREC